MSGESAATGPDERPGARSFPLVMTVFGALLAVGVLVGAAIHRRYIAFDRIVAHHVPDDTTLAVRWDVEKVTLFEPTRRLLLPLLDEKPNADELGDPSRRRRLARESGLEIGRDLREVLALFGPKPGDWAVVAGGAFPSDGVTDAVERVLREEGRSVRRIGAELLESPEGVAFGRAGDGALVVASSRERLLAALAVRPSNGSIPRTGAGGFFVRADASELSPFARATLDELGDVSRVEGVARWGTPLVVDVTVDFRGGPPADILTRGQRAFRALLGPGPLPRMELVELRTQRGLLRVYVDDAVLERALRRAGEHVRAVLWREGAKYRVP
jgi:hypothetical protein